MYSLCDAENFKPANPMVTPVHIKPEWYFLFAYANSNLLAYWIAQIRVNVSY